MKYPDAIVWLLLSIVIVRDASNIVVINLSLSKQYAY